MTSSRGGNGVFIIKSYSTEAVRESLQKIWESCLPRRKIRQIKHNQYFVPDLNATIFLRKRKTDFLKDLLLKNKNQIELVKRIEHARLQTTREMLKWKTATAKTEN